MDLTARSGGIKEGGMGWVPLIAGGRDGSLIGLVIQNWITFTRITFGEKWGVIVFVERRGVECWVYRDHQNDSGKEDNVGRVRVEEGLSGRTHLLCSR